MKNPTITNQVSAELILYKREYMREMLYCSLIVTGIIINVMAGLTQ